jgi:ABC-2 type transport system ATP-binding protein
METIIQFKNVTKVFGNKSALSNLSFQLSGKKVIGLLGPNGAGKTTVIQLILGLIKSSEGDVLINNNDAWLNREENAKKIGVVLETPKFYPDLSALANLKIFARLLEVNLKIIPNVLEKVNLMKAGNTPFGSYSLGMKQRLSIALCLLKKPEILIFDEPTNGLDPQGIVEVRNLIHSLAEEGNLCIFSSHLLSEVEQICSEIILLKNGELVEHFLFGSSHKVGLVRYKISCENIQSLISFLNDNKDLTTIIDVNKNYIIVECPSLSEIGYLNKKLCDNNIYLTEISPKGTLEEIVMEKLNVKS